MSVARPDKFKDRVQIWGAKIGVRPARIHVQSMKRKWASCSTAGRVCFSTALLREEAAFQDVVIVHELLHLRIPNHGRLFRSLLTAYLPAWQRTAGQRISRMCGFTADGNGS